MSGAMNKAIFLDRDGVINKLLTSHPDRQAQSKDYAHAPSNYVVRWDQFEFIPEALEGLKLLADTDYLIIVVSNQSGIGRGYVDYQTVLGIFERMVGNVEGIDGIRDYGGKIDHYVFCHHVPDAGCSCRKPKPGMLYCSALHWDIDLSQSWMIGDSDSDMIAAARARMGKRIKIQPHYTSDDVAKSSIYLANNLLKAAEKIIATAKT